MRAVNPVLRREVVERWRSRRATITLTLYLAVLGGVMYLLYRVGTAVLDAQFGFGFDPATAGPVLGRFLVEGLLFFVLLLVLFVGPGYAAAQISGERERRTLTLLQVTLLRPVQIVLGKLGAAVAWLTLLVVAAVPLGAVAFFLGGIGITDLLRSGLLLVVVALSIAAMALGISSLTRKTTGAIVLTYGLVLTLVLGTFFLAGVELIFRGTRGEQVRTPVALYLNPFFGLADAVNARTFSNSGFSGLPSPLGVIAEALPGSPAMGGMQDVEVGQGVMVEEFAVGGAGGGFAEAPMPMPRAAVIEPQPGDLDADGLEAVEVVPRPPDIAVDAVPAQVMPEPFVVPEQRAPARRPVWLIVMGIYLALGALGVLLATRRLRVTEPRGRGVATAPAVAGPTTPAAPAAGGWEGPR